MSDLLNMEFINSLPQPLFVWGYGSWWPVYDIDVESGLMRIDACGMLDVTHFDRVIAIRDCLGKEYDTEDFYTKDEESP